MFNMRVNTMIFLFLTLVFACCNNDEPNKPLLIVNNSNESIQVLWFHPPFYPDTTLSEIEPDFDLPISPNESRGFLRGKVDWNGIFEHDLLSDTLSIVFISQATLAKYDWNTIRNDYKILKRYDLSLGDLERLDFTVTYPPNASMDGVKTYPPE